MKKSNIINLEEYLRDERNYFLCKRTKELHEINDEPLNETKPHNTTAFFQLKILHYLKALMCHKTNDKLRMSKNTTFFQNRNHVM